MAAKNNPFCKKLTLNCNGRILDFTTPRIMGILNLTPDSFYDGGRFVRMRDVVQHAARMLEEGADILDAGGVSSRPGAPLVEPQEEMARVIPALRELRKAFPDAIISVDTFRAAVAEVAVNEGADMINDISAGALDPDMIETVARLKIPYILMHMKGTPATMQQQPHYEDVTAEISDFFTEKLSLLSKAGVQDIILDPGFGFGKSVEHNYTLLKNFSHFRIFGLPLMVGISRKSMICRPLKLSPAEALNGTTALHAIALLNGADLLRVHDVAEARQTVELIKLYHCVSKPAGY
ncbi:MAG: dihydropteroate synthase [Chitinophagales bacterium]|nr:MAG: dihydropteroate synthase [Chitinophagales bacterium]